MGELKYKVGDRVRVKSLKWYNENKTIHGDIWFDNAVFVGGQSLYCGCELTICLVTDGSYHVIENDYYWTDDMIECKVEDETKPEPKFYIGDKVILDPYPCIVTDIHWIDGLHGFVYTVRGTDFGKTVKEDELEFDERLTPTIDETIRLIKNDWNNFKDRYNIPDDYHFVDKNGNEINISEIVLEKKKKEYPKTFAECCKVLGLSEFEYNHTGTKVWYRHRLMATLDKLMLCRDAYWEIAGEEMGLDKPWEPDWDDGCYVIFTNGDGLIKKDIQFGINAILAFPTEEMRDIFYENFKSEIEICKKLL